MDKREEQSNVWEKLVELIEESTGVVYGGEYGDEEICPQIDISDEEIERIADRLVSHGVTVQEWISQTELPWMGEEIAKLCIRYMEDYADFHGYASSKKVTAHIVRLLELEKDGRIAILPQPPEGE